ncbi:PREDICTED: uncharacterized protein LOC105364085 [Ceratosolen solmsi marchali]|uniref:Uncharacterized protein LOC105364085 n=1 Tax=Ceratosolen solmsi marchali TaxID=326594 RepID=A0AAJ6YLH1_9HYME|nr:PREDICTED: uncharacterized protein LOC105364085 [Ceratosolen solmsi marchali]
MSIQFKSKFNQNSKWWLKSIPKAISWTDINILRFLLIYKSFSVLWNIYDPQYKNEKIRLLTYKNIAETLNLKNVDEQSCMQLIEELKKRYIREKEIFKNANNKQPVWFNVLHGIIKNSLRQNSKSIGLSLLNCNYCSKKQNLESLSSYHLFEGENVDMSKDNFKNCEECCNNVNISGSCELNNVAKDVIENVIEDPTIIVKILKEDKNKKCLNFKEACNQIMCHIMTNDNRKTGEVDFKQDFKEIYQVICVEVKDDRNYKSNETNEDSDDALSAPQSQIEFNKDSNCTCSFNKESTIASSDSAKDFQTEDFSICSLIDKDINGDNMSLNDEKDFFKDSLRFYGKPISLVNKFIRNNKDGYIDKIEPRKHFAAYSTNSQTEIYPLQLGM